MPSLERLRNDNTTATQRSEQKGDPPLISQLQLQFLYNQGDPMRCVAVVLSFRNLSIVGIRNLRICETEYRISTCQVSNLWIVWTNFAEIDIKDGLHDPIFGANYYSNSKKLAMEINISMS